MKARIILALVATFPVTANAAPDFVPKPGQAYEGFVALNPPRADVPVGALWIDGYGPTGDAAATSNLEAVRSLNGMTIDHNLQISLSAGLFDLIGVDPRLRDHYTARFTDLSVVRVKDVSGLAGAPGEPRIIEALKAASVTVSTEGEIGLNARTIGFQTRDVDGNGTSGRTRMKMIEGRDLFVAVRVAQLELVQGKERSLKLSRASPEMLVADLDAYRIFLKQSCSPVADNAVPKCDAPVAGVLKLSTHPAAVPAALHSFDAGGSISLTLPVPTSDERGGLYDRIILRLSEKCRISLTAQCREGSAQYAGQRLQDVTRVRAKGW